MTEDDVFLVSSARDHYFSLVGGIDVINSLYNYSQLHQPKGIMKDLCDALEVDGYYRLIDDAFTLTPSTSPLSVFQLRVRLKLGEITTLARVEWDAAYQWAVSAHMMSRVGLEFFKLQQFRQDLHEVPLCESDAVLLLAELNGDYSARDRYLPFLHSRFGYMPSYFSDRTKRLYAKAISEAAAKSAIAINSNVAII